MKKLMIGLVAASATIFAFGALPSGTSFEAYETGEKTIEDLTAHEDNGVGTGDNRYWFYEGEKIGVAIGVITNGTPNVDSRPAQFAGNSNLQYLDLTSSDATNVLYRAINSVAGKSAVAYLDGQSIDNGLYLDTLVKFTPGELTSLELGDGDKIALTYVEETDDEDGDGKVLSNIVVRAGYVNGSTVDPVNYVMNPIPGFSAADWHRLTVRAINVGYADAPVGFVVYVDGVEVTYDLAQVPGDSAYLTALAGNSIVANYLYNTEKHAFIPSAVNTGTAKTTLSAVGFKGNGCVDDISFTAEPPTFIQEGTTVTIAWDDNVTSYTVATNGATMVDGEAVSGEGSANLLIADGTTTITVSATYGDGYTNGVWTASAGTLSAGDWTGFESGATLTIKSLYPYFQVGDAYYQEFAGVNGALAAALAGGGVIKLNANYSKSISFSTGNIVLDLNGKTLQGGDSSYYTINNSGAVLTIIDSASGGTVLAPTKVGAEGAFYTDDGQTTINAGTFESTVYTVKMQDSEAAGDIVINGGVFADPDYDSTDVDSKFYLYDYLGDGVKATYNEGYFTVGSDTPEPPAPTLIPVPTAATTLVYDGSEQTGVATGDGYTLGGTYAATNAGEYEATATPDAGYAWSDGTTHTTNISWSIAKASVTATASLTVTEATYDSNKTTVTDYTTPSFNFGLGAPTLVENTDYTVAWSATEVSGAGTFTYTVSPVAGSNYTFTEASVTLTITEGGSYPSYIDPTDTDAKAKYDSWSAYAGVTPAAAAELEDAFLLNCLPAEVDAAKAAFKITSISYDTTQAKWVVTYTDGYNERKYNGTVTVKQYSDVGCKTESATGTFFKATLDL